MTTDDYDIGIRMLFGNDQHAGGHINNCLLQICSRYVSARGMLIVATRSSIKYCHFLFALLIVYRTAVTMISYQMNPRHKMRMYLTRYCGHPLPSMHRQ